jgi:hypothetical protein
MLLLIWLALTVKLSVNNVQLTQDEEDALQRRAFITYYNSVAGCLVGAYFATSIFNDPPLYVKCVDYGYKQKFNYLKRMEIQK